MKLINQYFCFVCTFVCCYIFCYGKNTLYVHASIIWPAPSRTFKGYLGADNIRPALSAVKQCEILLL